MKHLLNGVTVAAALAVAAPAWGQAPTTPVSPAAPNAAVPMAPMPGMATKQRHKRVPTTMVRHSSGNAMTDQLNREELARIEGGSAPPPMPMGAAGQPSPTMGIPGGTQPSASTHPVQR
jgi:hypothetical protein